MPSTRPRAPRKLVVALQELRAGGGVVEEVHVGVDDGPVPVAPPGCLAHRNCRSPSPARRVGSRGGDVRGPDTRKPAPTKWRRTRSRSSPCGRPAARARSSSASPTPPTPSPAHPSSPADTATATPWPAAKAESRDGRRPRNSSPRSPHPARSARLARPAEQRTSPPATAQSAPRHRKPNLATRRRKHGQKGPEHPDEAGTFSAVP
jgi:hypothetical protein